jgi:hypothetical protein
VAQFNFVDKFLEITNTVESPTSYLTWAAYVTVGATLRSNVYIDFPRRKSKITPNLYVLLVGDSGATRKSTPLKITNYLLKTINNTKLIEGRASIQGVMKELAEIRRTDKTMLEEASGLLYAEEFAAMLVKDPSTSGLLTDLYDYHETYDVILKGEGSVKLTKVAFSILSATNAAFLQDMFTKTDIYGGLVGRTIFIIEDKARLKNLGLGDSEVEEEWEQLLQHLTYLSRLEGKVRFTADAERRFNNWYDNADFSINESKTGFEHRMHTHALKLALILAASEEDFSLVIHEHHCIKAINVITELRPTYHKLVTKATYDLNSTRQAIKDITSILLVTPNVSFTRASILQRLHGNIDAECFDKAIATLDQSGFITMNGVNIPEYKLSQKGREMIMGEINGRH